MPHRNGHTAIEMSPKPHRRHHRASPNNLETPHVHESTLGSNHGRNLSPHADRSPHGSRSNVSQGSHGSHGSHSNVPHSSNGNNLNVHSGGGHHGDTHSAPTSHSTSLNNMEHADPPQPHSRHRRDVTVNVDAANEVAPLLETDNTKPKPPIAGPEIDDLDDNTSTPAPASGQPGVDDGFYNSGDESAPDDKRETDDEDPMTPNGVDIASRFNPDTPFPMAPEFMPGATPRVIPDVNVYQQKKNLAQGMMDLALLSANANQLRYVLEAGSEFHPYFYASMVFISASLILQIAVGVGLIANSTYDVKDRDEICKADRINNFTVIGIFLITVVNVFIASFGVAQYPQGPVAAMAPVPAG